MSKLAFEGFLKEERIYYFRDGHFSQVLNKIMGIIGGTEKDSSETIVLETNDIEFSVDKKNELVVALFLYGDPVATKPLRLTFQDFSAKIQNIVNTPQIS